MIKNIIATYYLIGIFVTIGFISKFSRHIQLDIVEVIFMLFGFPLIYPLFIGKVVAEILIK